MKKFILCLAVSIFAVTSSVRADDNKAPTPKPAAKEVAKPAAPAVATPSVATAPVVDCCSDAAMTSVKVLMSPKAASFASK